MAIEGHRLHYAKKETDLKSSKGVKSIDLKDATITSEKESSGKYWIYIKKGKITRHIAAQSNEARTKWVNALTTAAGGGGGAESSGKEKKR